MLTFILFIALLSVLVLVHEYGHFWTARKMGMNVEEFGIGFPPRAFKIKRNGTIYSINWLPLGGFVKIKGEDGSQRNDPDSFASKKPGPRLLVLSAGVLMNYALAIVLLSIGFMIGLPQSIDGTAGAEVRDRKVQIVQVLPGSPAEKSGVSIGDEVVSFNGEAIMDSAQLVGLAGGSVGQTAAFVFKRGEEVINKDIEIVVLEETGKGGIGVGLLATGVISYPPHIAIAKGVTSTVKLSGQMFSGFYNIIKNLVTGKGAGAQVSGPIGIAVMTGEVAKLGFSYLIQFAALLSINLAVLNFLPFPALDGGRALFVIIEKIRNKPVSQKIESIFHAVGFALLMLLIIVVTFKDIVRFIK